MKVYDVSVPLHPDMPTYKGEPAPRLEFTSRLDRGDYATVSVLSLGSHAGTHVDAPSHFIPGAPGIEALPPDVLVGPATVVHYQGQGHITAEEIETLSIPDGCERLLFKTSNGSLHDRPELSEDFIGLTADAAEYLVRAGVKLAGIDYLSIEPFDAAVHEVHRTLLADGVVILESLDLRAVPPGPYLMVCAPLKVVGAEGAPARVFLIDLSDDPA